MKSDVLAHMYVTAIVKPALFMLAVVEWVGG